MSFRLPRGMRDIEDKEYIKIEKIRSAFNETCKLFGFKMFMPSPIEMLETLEVKSGSGIKDEIYHFKDKKERNLGLRFDLTVGTTRHIAGKKDLRRPFRVGTFGDMFRYDEPQKGRYRWFHQWNAEIYHTSGESEEWVIELLNFTTSLLNKIGINNFKIKLGNIEIAEEFVSRLLYEQNVDSFRSSENKVQQVTATLRLLDKIGKKSEKQIIDEAIEIGLKKEKAEILIRFGNIKSNDIEKIKQEVKIIFKESGIMVDEKNKEQNMESFLENFISSRLGKGKFNLTKDMENLEYDLGLVRGMDYYDGFVFEIVDLNNKDIGSIAGGGEYSRLLESFSGPPNLSAIGIAGGVERMMESISKHDEKEKLVIVIDDEEIEGEHTNDNAQALIKKLRNNNVPTTFLVANDFRKHIKFAEANNATIVIIAGKKELVDGKYRVKDLKTGKEELVKKESLINFIKELI